MSSAAVRKPRFISVGIKLAVATLLVLAVATAAVYYALIEHERQGLLSAKSVAGKMVSNLFAANATAPLEFEDPEAINEVIGKLSNNEEIVYGALWGLDMMTGENGERAGEFKREGHEVSVDDPGTNVEPVTTWSDDYVTFSVAVKDAMGERIGQAVVVFSLERENAALVSSKRSILMTSFGMAGALVVLLMGLARFVIVRPLDRLIAVAGKLEKGDTKAGAADLAQARERDEVGRLAVGFKHMAEAIEEREDKIAKAQARLEGRNHDMRLVLDNVEQGFVTMNVDGTVAPERSAIFDTWFGDVGADDKLWDVLGRDDEEISVWFELGWESVTDGFLPLDLSLDQMPSELQIGERYFQFGYNPIMEGEELAKVLVVVTDVTADVERKQAEERQGEILAVFSRISRDRSGFVEFFEETGRIVEQIGEVEDEALLKRLIHTVKGNCGIYEIPSVARACHEVEENISEAGEVTQTHKDAVAEAWAQLCDRIAPMLGDDGDRVEIERDEYEAFLKDLRTHAPHAALASRAISWQHEPASKRLERFAEQAGTLATKLGKGDLETFVDGGDVRFPADTWQEFWGAFVHVVRNAVDHGVETPEEREAAGKSPNGKVNLSMRRTATEVIVEMRDDGRGIAWDKIRAKAEAGGLPCATQADLVAALFTDGVSSRDQATSTSGRGVGMAAVKDATEAMGGRIQVQTKPGEGTVFRFRFPVATLDVASRDAGTRHAA